MTAQALLFDYAMPSLGADMDEGSVIEWLVKVGDRVERGQVVARVETEKSDIDIEIWHGGMVEEIVVQPNLVVPVGTTLLRISAAGAKDAPEPAQPPTEPTTAASVYSEPVGDQVQASRQTGRVHHDLVERINSDDSVWASPLARQLAGERGIVLTEVLGSGPGGAVRARDLPSRSPVTPGAAEARGVQPPRSALSRSDRMRSMIAERMTRSNSEIPHYRLQRDVDLACLVDHLSSINETRPVADRVVPAAAFVRAVAIAAHRHPELNGTWSDNCFHPAQGVNISVAISLRSGGLVTPTIRDADTISLDESMSLLREFTTAARSGTMRSEWTTGNSSITITNLGERGADLVHGLISPPEVALVGFGRIIERPWVVNGEVVPRPIVTVTLGADHRATDGAVGSRFLSTLANALEKPEKL
jgi:pyruvate dehydrogenase E2 component (dihydrolipoamide acetyltransferase)